MEIRFITEWRFEAMVDGGIRTFSVTNPINTSSGNFLLYVDEEKALAGEFEVLTGKLVEEDGRTLLKEAVTEDPVAAQLIESMRKLTLGGLRSGIIPPVQNGTDEDEDEEAYWGIDCEDIEFEDDACEEDACEDVDCEDDESEDDESEDEDREDDDRGADGCGDDDDEIGSRYLDLCSTVRDVAPEAERPEMDLTPEERLLVAIFGEKIPEGIAETTRNRYLLRLILGVME